MNTAIVLAGGKGKRMKSSVPKQFMELKGEPLLSHSVRVFQNSSIIDEIVVVTSPDYISYVKEEIVNKNTFDKVKHITSGGAERYDSVYEGLKCVESPGYVFIHDGARPCVTDKIISDCYDAVRKFDACVAAVPVKDTIKVSDSEGMAVNTPDRSRLWQIQTPQVFDVNLVKECYKKMYSAGDKSDITDDAMVVERFGNKKIKLVNADYRNIKVTTPEDIDMALSFLK